MKFIILYLLKVINKRIISGIKGGVCEMKLKHFMAVIATLVIILAGCSNSGSNDSGNKSSDSSKKDSDNKQE